MYNNNTSPNSYQTGYVPQDPYNQGNPYANPTNPYGNPTNPYGNPTNPYGNPTNPYGDQNQYYQQNPVQGTYPDAIATPIGNPNPGTTPVGGDPGYTTYNPPPNNNVGYNPSVYYQQQGDYDPYNINYQQISIDQWQQIPCQQTEYSQYWDSPNSFQPETYSENTKKETHCNDIFWNVFFWLNFCGTIALLVYLIVTKKTGDEKISIKLDGIKFADIGIAAAVGLGLGIVVNIIHFLFIACCPLCYLKFGMIVGFIYSVISAILFAFLGGSLIAFVFPVVYIILLVVFYCYACKYIEFSSKILKMAAKLLLQYPGLICFCLFQILWTLIVNAMFCVIIYFVQKRGLHPAVYLYVVFSYLWCTLTFEYVEYITVSGVASTWYFLYETDYFPNSPVCQSYKRAMSTSFGSAAFAGFILAVIQFLQFILDATKNNTSDGSNGTLDLICCILRCCAQCILCILERLVSTLNRYALIYCAAFGIPYIAACKRFVELECTRFIRVIMSSCVISQGIAYNLIVYSIASALAGFGLGHLIFKGKDEYSEATRLLFKIFTCCFALLFTFGIYEVVIEPIETMADTLLVCFSENPENLKTTAYDLYELIADQYNDQLGKHILSNTNDEDKP